MKNVKLGKKVLYFHETQHMLIFGQNRVILWYWNFCKKKKPQKSRETTQGQRWFQIKKIETILKPSWFHKNWPSSKFRPKIEIFLVKN